MKKLLFIFVSVLMALPAFAQTWQTANQVTVAWEQGVLRKVRLPGRTRAAGFLESEINALLAA